MCWRILYNRELSHSHMTFAYSTGHSWKQSWMVLMCNDLICNGIIKIRMHQLFKLRVDFTLFCSACYQQLFIIPENHVTCGHKACGMSQQYTTPESSVAVTITVIPVCVQALILHFSCSILDPKFWHIKIQYCKLVSFYFYFTLKWGHYPLCSKYLWRWVMLPKNFISRE